MSARAEEGHQRRRSASDWSTDALDAIALTVALEISMLVDDGAAARQREHRRRYEEDPYTFRGENDYDPAGVAC